LLAVNGVVDDLGVFSDFPGFCDLVGEGGLVIYGEMMLPLAGSKRARASPIKDFVGDTFVGLMNDASAVVVFNFAISAFTLLFGLAQHLFGLHLIGLLLGDVFGEGGQAMLVPVDGTSESTDLCFAAAGTDVSFVCGIIDETVPNGWMRSPSVLFIAKTGTINFSHSISTLNFSLILRAAPAGSSTLVTSGFTDLSSKTCESTARDAKSSSFDTLDKGSLIVNGFDLSAKVFLRFGSSIKDLDIRRGKATRIVAPRPPGSLAGTRRTFPDAVASEGLKDGLDILISGFNWREGRGVISTAPRTCLRSRERTDLLPSPFSSCGRLL